MRDLSTEFAPAERASWEMLLEQIETVRQHRLTQAALEGGEEVFLVLNEARQIVHANQAFLEKFGVADPATLYGCRLGEVLGCLDAAQGPGGCGTSANCRFCNAAQAVLTSVNGFPDIQKCSIARAAPDNPLEFYLLTAPLQVSDHDLVLAQIADPDTHDFTDKVFHLQKIIIRCSVS